MNKGAGEIINDANGSKSSLICAPLKIKDKTVGIIKLENSNQVNYSSEDLKLLNAIATQAAIAIENANLYDSLREAFFETVQILVEVVEKKDSYTAGHARRVAIYSTAIGEELGLTKTELTKVKLAALLHDIGKIGIQDEILLKKGKLTNEEYESIKKHPVLGAELLENITQFKDIVPYVRSHHERYDGRGYPDGIHKENIPLVSRILAVADSFDAMTSNRPYRPTMNREYAFGELKKNASTQFDPIVVEAFLKRITM
jgi:putative nucleotidyltransferase with HDIG domain